MWAQACSLRARLHPSRPADCVCISWRRPTEWRRPHRGAAVQFGLIVINCIASLDHASKLAISVQTLNDHISKCRHRNPERSSRRGQLLSAIQPRAGRAKVIGKISVMVAASWALHFDQAFQYARPPGTPRAERTVGKTHQPSPIGQSHSGIEM